MCLMQIGLNSIILWRAHEKLVLIAPLNAHAYISSGASGLDFGLSVHLLRPFVCKQRLLWRVCAFAARQYDKYKIHDPW